MAKKLSNNYILESLLLEAKKKKDEDVEVEEAPKKEKRKLTERTIEDREHRYEDSKSDRKAAEEALQGEKDAAESYRKGATKRNVIKGLTVLAGTAAGAATGIATGNAALTAAGAAGGAATGVMGAAAQSASEKQTQKAKDKSVGDAQTNFDNADRKYKNNLKSLKAGYSQNGITKEIEEGYLVEARGWVKRILKGKATGSDIAKSRGDGGWRLMAAKDGHDAARHFGTAANEYNEMSHSKTKEEEDEHRRKGELEAGHGDDSVFFGKVAKGCANNKQVATESYSEYELMQILDENGFTTTDEDIALLREALESGAVVLNETKIQNMRKRAGYTVDEHGEYVRDENGEKRLDGSAHILHRRPDGRAAGIISHKPNSVTGNKAEPGMTRRLRAKEGGRELAKKIAIAKENGDEDALQAAEEEKTKLRKLKKAGKVNNIMRTIGSYGIFAAVKHSRKKYNEKVNQEAGKERAGGNNEKPEEPEKPEQQIKEPVGAKLPTYDVIESAILYVPEYINLDEGLTEYQLMQILNENGFTTTDEDVALLWEALESGVVVLTEEDPVEEKHAHDESDKVAHRENVPESDKPVFPSHRERPLTFTPLTFTQRMLTKGPVVGNAKERKLKKKDTL